MQKLNVWLAGAAMVLLAVGQAQTANAQDPGVVIVHGINGTDLGFDKDLPVDIRIGDTCAFTDVIFETQTDVQAVDDPANLPVQISLAFDPNAGADPDDCEGLVVIDTTLDVLFGQTAVIIAHLNDSGQPKASIFNANLAELPSGKARVSVQHTAAAPAVNVVIKPYRKLKNAAFITDLTNSEQAVRTVKASTALIKISPQQSPFTSVFKAKVPLEEGVNTLIFAVGTLANGTFQPIIVTLKTTEPTS